MSGRDSVVICPSWRLALTAEFGFRTLQNPTSIQQACPGEFGKISATTIGSMQSPQRSDLQRQRRP
jgi:hypothetical protein